MLASFERISIFEALEEQECRLAGLIKVAVCEKKKKKAFLICFCLVVTYHYQVPILLVGSCCAVLRVISRRLFCCSSFSITHSPIEAPLFRLIFLVMNWPQQQHFYQGCFSVTPCKRQGAEMIWK